MTYQIAYTAAARLDLKWLAQLHKRHVATITDALPEYLADQPTVLSTKRREMETNPLGATWHLRLGELRVYHDIEEAAQTVWILRAGIKRRNRLSIRGEEFDLRDLGDANDKETRP